MTAHSLDGCHSSVETLFLCVALHLHLWKSMLCEKALISVLCASVIILAFVLHGRYRFGLGSKRVSGGRLLLLLRLLLLGATSFRFRSGSTFSQEFPQMSQHGGWPHEATIGPVSDSQRRSCCATRSMFICASYSPAGSPSVLPGTERSAV